MRSFDALLRTKPTQGTSKRRHWHKRSGALDVKLTGSSEPFGLDSPTVRRWLATGRLVLRDARKDKNSPLRDCAFAAYLARRPKGPTYTSKGGRVHAGAYGFIAFDAETLTSWDPKTKVPKPFLMLGDQIIGGIKPESEAMAEQP